MNYSSFLLVGAAAATLATAAGGLAHAQPVPGERASNAIAEVVVTARKREESLQRIPVAVTTETGAQLAQMRITQPTDLTRVAPSLLITQSAGSDNSSQIQLRAQSSSDSLLGLSQPVGLYEDSVNIPHPKGSGSAFVDVQRVEILNGPQGTLYGRNTTGGAVNIITKDANYNGVHGYLEGEVGNFNDYRGVGAVNVPIIPDVLAVRVAYQHWSQQGFGKSIYSGQHFGNDHDDDTVRLSIKFDPTANIDVVGKFEYGRADRTASMVVPFSPPPAARGGLNNIAGIALSVLNPAEYNTLLAAGNAAGIVAAGTPLVANCFGNWDINCSTEPQHDRVTTYHGVLDAKWRITDDMTLRSVTGFHQFIDYAAFDLAGMPGNYNSVGGGIGGIQPTAGPSLPLPQEADQGSTQWTQELNLSGKFFDDRLDWLIGAFGSWDKGAGGQIYIVQYAPPTPANDAYIIGNNDGLLNESDSYAFFTQDDWHLTKRISITTGLRYTHEHLVQLFNSWNFEPNGSFVCGATGLAPPNGNRDLCYTLPSYTGGPGAPYQHVDSDGTTYLLSFNYQATDDVLFYLKTARGFRGSAFGRNPQPPAKPEIDVDYEFGMKGDFLEHRLRVDLALYQTNYTNKQEQAATCTGLPFGTPVPANGCLGFGSFTTILANAASARIRGVELQFQARPVSALSLFGSMTYTDAKYLKFTNAIPENQALYPAPYDLSGQTLTGIPTGTPLWKIDVGGRYEWALGPGTLGVQADYAYRSSLPITPLNTDPNMPLALQQYIDRAVGLVNARMDYEIASQGLNFAVWVTNLNDERYGYVGLNSTYINGVGTANAAPPRTFGFTVRKTFGGE